MGNLSPNFNRARTRADYAGNPVVGRPEIIVLHLTEGSFASARGTFLNPVSEASSTVLLGKNLTVLEMVAEADAPWTNGFAHDQTEPPTSNYVLENFWNPGRFKARVSPNLFSLTVEVEWFAADGIIPVDSPLFRKLVEIVSVWCYRYGIPATRERIIGHNEISPREKPLCGRHIPWAEFIPAVAVALHEFEERYGKSIIPTTTPTDTDRDGDHELEEDELDPVPFEDDSFPSEWAIPGWNLAKAVGITDGSKPHRAATREETVAMILRAFEVVGITFKNPGEKTSENA